MILIHVGAVAAAFVLGVVLLVGPKGKLPHRILGWVWASLMVAAAVSSLFIRTSGAGMFLGFSPLHIFSVWTLIVAPLGVSYARRHKVSRHRSAMMGLFFGGLVFAGALAFLPGRTMHAVVFG